MDIPEQPSTVADGKDLDSVWKHPVDHAVVLDDDLVNVVSTELQDDAASSRKHLEALDGPQHPHGKHASIAWRVSCDIR